MKSASRNGLVMTLLMSSVALGLAVVEYTLVNQAQTPVSYKVVTVESDSELAAIDEDDRVPIDTDVLQGVLDEVRRHIAAARYDDALAILTPLAASAIEEPRVYFYLGRVLSERDNVPEAIDNYRKALDRRPAFQAVALNLGLLLLQSDQHEEAVRVLEHAQSITSGRLKAKALVLLGRAELNIGHYPSAEAHFRKASEYRPQWYSPWRWLGRAELASGDVEEAIVALSKAQSLDPDNPDLFADLANVHLQAGDTTAAKDELKRALALNRKHQRAREMLVEVFQRRGSYGNAIRHLGKLADQHEGAGKGLLYRSQMALLKDQPELAIELASQAETLDEQLGALTAIVKIRAWLAAGRPESAYDLAADLQQHNPADPGALSLLAAALHQLEKPKEAEGFADRAAVLAPGDPIIWFLVGQIKDTLGKPDEAIGAYQRALSISPASRSSALHLASVLRRQGEIEQARTTYQELLQRSPNYTPVLFNLALLEADAGQPAAAKAHYRLILSIAPDHTRAANNLAVLLKHSGSYEEARDLLLAVVAQDPANTDARFNLALLYEELGQIDKALIELARVNAAAPEFYKGWKARTRLEILAGDSRSACVSALAGDAIRGDNNRTLQQSVEDGFKYSADQHITKCTGKIASSGFLAHPNLLSSARVTLQ